MTPERREYARQRLVSLRAKLEITQRIAANCRTTAGYDLYRRQVASTKAAIKRWEQELAKDATPPQS